MPASFKIFGYDATSTLELVNGEDTSIIMLRGALEARMTFCLGMSASTTQRHNVTKEARSSVDACR